MKEMWPQIMRKDIRSRTFCTTVWAQSLVGSVASTTAALGLLRSQVIHHTVRHLSHLRRPWMWAITKPSQGRNIVALIGARKGRRIRSRGRHQRSIRWWFRSRTHSWMQMLCETTSLTSLSQVYKARQSEPMSVIIIIANKTWERKSSLS